MHPVFQLRLPEAPVPPERFSPSALTAIEICPRRWWLEHGQYSHLGGPYPRPVYPAAALGTIVHGVLDAFATTLRDAGNPEPGSSAFLEARQSFPLRSMVQQLRNSLLDNVRDNPRVNIAELSAQLSIDVLIRAFKSLILRAYPYELHPTEQGSVSSSHGIDASTLVASGEPVPMCGTTPALTPSAAIPCPATLAEVRVKIDNPPLYGLIDLVLTKHNGDTLIEFKTGAFKPEHELQSMIYAVLWSRSTGRSIQQRLLLYSSDESVELGGFTRTQLEQATEALRQCVIAARSAITAPLPEAKPSAEGCSYCPVRQLCDQYWRSDVTRELRWRLTANDLMRIRNGPMTWGDLEIDLTTAHVRDDGFVIDLPGPTGENLQLRCAIPPKYIPGAIAAQHRIRMINISLRRKGNNLRVVWSKNSEVYWGQSNARGPGSCGA